MVVALEDPILDGAPGGVTDFVVRAAFQQFPYQQPMFNSTARVRPMFKRSYPRPRYQVLDDALIERLLGGDIDLFVDSAPFFNASAIRNQGRFDPRWLSGPQFEPIRERADLDVLVNIFERVWSDTQANLKAACRANRSVDHRLRQYDFNPLVGAPFVRVGSGEYLAPQTWYAATRVGASALFYAGFKEGPGLGQALATDLGHLNEDYALDQLRQLHGRAHVSGALTYDPDGGKQTVDALIVTPQLTWLIEVKSTRANLNAQRSYQAYLELLRRDIDTAFGQIATTANLIRSRHPVLAELVPGNAPIVGSVVTAEPLFQANTVDFRDHLTDPTLPTAVLSMRELEDAVAFGLVLPVHEVAARIAGLELTRYPDPQDAFLKMEQQLGKAARNPMLDQAWNEGAWAPGSA
jgi:hypothetical protein